jgi:hypothetical protein
MAVWEQLRAHFGNNRRNLVASHSTCANIKKAHTLILGVLLCGHSVDSHFDSHSRFLWFTMAYTDGHSMQRQSA